MNHLELHIGIPFSWELVFLWRRALNVSNWNYFLLGIISGIRWRIDEVYMSTGEIIPIFVVVIITIITDDHDIYFI